MRATRFVTRSALARRHHRLAGAGGVRRSRLLATLLATVAVFGCQALLTTLSAQAATPTDTAAVNWAIGQIGSTSYYDLCLTFVQRAYQNGAGLNIEPLTNYGPFNSNTYPQQVWDDGFHAGTTGGSNTTPPYGALVFFNDPSDYEYSHVEIMGSGGEMISSPDAFDESAVHYETLSQAAHSGAYASYVGWWLPDGSSGSGGAGGEEPLVTVTNLLTDGSFSGGGYGWEGTPPEGGGMNRAVYDDASLAHEGNYFMEANTNPNGGSLLQNTSVNLPAESSVTASIWARLNPSNPASGQYIALCVWDLNSLTNSCDNLYLTHTWEPVQTTLTLPVATTQLRTQVYMYGTGNMDFDGAVLTQNLLTDGSFSGGGYGWEGTPPEGGGMNRAVYDDASLAHEGNYFMEANTNPNGGSLLQNTSVNLPAESSVTASIWARLNPSNPASGQYIALCVWDLNSLTNSCDNLYLTHTWEPVQTTLTLPVATTQLRTQVYMYGTGNMDFDGAVLTQNLLTDGSFSGGGYGWEGTPPEGGGMNRAVYDDASLAHEGNYFMEANTNPNGGSLLQNTSVNLPAESSVTASIWARLNPSNPASGQYIALCVWDLNSLTNSCDNLYLTHTWEPVQTTLTLPVATTQLRTQVYMYGTGNMDFAGAVLGAPQTAESISAAPPAPTIGDGTPRSPVSEVLSGLVDPRDEPISECRFEYGQTTAYGSTARCGGSLGEGEVGVPVSATVAGLKAATEYHFRLVAVGPGGTTESADATFTTEAFGITTETLPEGTAYTKTNKALYVATLTAAGGKPPYKWSLATGSKLPPGLKLSSKGAINGKASAAGTYTFTVQVVDTKTKTKPPTQDKATATLSITINPA